MKLKLIAFVLAASLAAFGQGRSSGHAGGAPMGGPPAGMGSGAGTIGMPHGHPGGDMGNTGATSHPSGNLSKQSPDTALSRSPQLSTRLDALLPKGENAQQACSGFKNLGQCVAAIHVSHNLGIPFDDLKAKMTGTGSESLGKAIQGLKPAVNAKAEAKKAQKQANQDLSQAAS